MNRTPSSGSSRLVSDLSSTESSEDKQSEQSKNKKKMPIMRSGTHEQEVEQKRNAYKNSKRSTHTQATRDLQQNFKKPPSTDMQSNTRTATTSTIPSYDVGSSSSRSSEPDETLLLTSTVSILGTTLSTSSTTSTVSTPVANPKWATLDEQVRNAQGRFFQKENTDLDVVCKWLASSPAGVHSAFFTREDISHSDVIKLFNSLKSNATLETLHFYNNRIGSEGAQVVAEALKHNKTLTTLKLCCNAIDTEGAKAIAKALKYNQSLTSLDLGMNLINYEGAKAIAEALKDNTTLTSLSLEANHINYKGVEALADSLKSNATINTLILDFCDVDDKGAQVVAEVLKHNMTITTLSLANNIISNLGAQAVAEALKHNTTLTRLNLCDNYIDTEGIKAITVALNYNTTLTTLDIENADSSGQITRELNKNRELLKTEKSAKAALEIIKDRLNARGASEDAFYPQEIMDELLTQMIQMGLKQEVIALGNEITPPKKLPKS